MLDADRGPHHLEGERFHHVGRDPGCAEPGGDVGRPKVPGLHLAQRLDVALVLRVLFGGGLGRLELAADGADQVLVGTLEIEKVLEALMTNRSTAGIYPTIDLKALDDRSESIVFRRTPPSPPLAPGARSSAQLPAVTARVEGTVRTDRDPVGPVAFLTISPMPPSPSGG